MRGAPPDQARVAPSAGDCAESVGTSLDDPTGCSGFYRTRTLSGRKMKRPLLILAAVAVVAVVVVGILQTGGGDDEPAAGAAPDVAALRGAPGPLAEVHRLANRTLPAEDLEARIEALRGYPIVINIWGSWCGPCRKEFPIFQRVSVRYGKEVAFLGVATEDAEENTAAFLEQRPVSYPSYMDFDGKIADSYGAIGAPATVFYDASGEKTYFHQGVYVDDADLIEDIERYATGA